jgi:hypothetical protein
MYILNNKIIISDKKQVGKLSNTSLKMNIGHT